jgi:predicted nuclease with RNAse H fold
MDSNPPTTADYASDAAYRNRRELDRLIEHVNAKQDATRAALEALLKITDDLSERVLVLEKVTGVIARD